MISGNAVFADSESSEFVILKIELESANTQGTKKQSAKMVEIGRFHVQNSFFFAFGNKNKTYQTWGTKHFALVQKQRTIGFNIYSKFMSMGSTSGILSGQLGLK